MTLQPYQLRVIAERKELDERLAKLIEFLPSPACLALDFEERCRLSRQSRIMAEYSQILGERIRAFEEQQL